MMQIIDNEMATWADVVQLAIEYIKTSSVLIPLFSLLWCVCVCVCVCVCIYVCECICPMYCTLCGYCVL